MNKELYTYKDYLEMVQQQVQQFKLVLKDKDVKHLFCETFVNVCALQCVSLQFFSFNCSTKQKKHTYSAFSCYPTSC